MADPQILVQVMQVAAEQVCTAAQAEMVAQADIILQELAELLHQQQLIMAKVVNLESNMAAAMVENTVVVVDLLPFQVADTLQVSEHLELLE